MSLKEGYVERMQLSVDRMMGGTSFIWFEFYWILLDINSRAIQVSLSGNTCMYGLDLFGSCFTFIWFP